MPIADLQPVPSDRRPPARSGFTLIEMLVVLGIILILVGISVGVFSSLAKSAKDRHTKVALETAKALLSEYEASAGKGAVANFVATYDNFTAEIDAALGLNSTITKAPGKTWPTWEAYSSAVLTELLRIPNNKAILDKLPPEQIRKSGTQYVLLDGYGNPILFVPAKGLINVTVNGAVGAAGSIKGHLQNDGRVTLNGGTAPNPRYFWMSCGADGKPQTGDDNHYSFEQ